MEENKKKKINEKELFMILIGTSLISFSIITATIQTSFGHFFTFLFSYLFGLFYPLILIGIFALGLYFIFARKLPKKIDNKKYYVAFSLLIVALLSFGSYYVILNNHSLKISDLIYVYNDKMKAFSSSSMKIDNFNGLGGLGGGIIGLFFVLLFGSILGYVGDAIFFSLMLLVSITLFIYEPVLKVFFKIKESVIRAKEKKYVSPYSQKAMKIEKSEEKYKIANEKRIPIANNSTSSTFYTQGAFIQDKKFIKPLDEKEIFSKPESNFVEIPLNHNQDVAKIEDIASHSSPTMPGENRISSFNNSAFSSDTMSLNKNVINEVKNENKEVIINSDSNGGLTDEDYQRHIKEEQLKDYNPQDYNPSILSSPEFESAPDYHPEDYINKNSEEQTPDYKPFENEFNTPSFENNNNDSLLSEMSKINENNNDYNEERHFSFNSDVDNNPESSYSSSFEESNSLFSSFDNAQKVDDNKEVSFNLSGGDDNKPAVEEEKEISEKERQAMIDSAYFERKTRERLERRNRQIQEAERKKAELMQFVSPRPRKYSYPLPGANLLTPIDDSAKIQINAQEGARKAKIIDEVFKEFGFVAKVTDMVIGASVTRLLVKTGAGVKADKLLGLTEQIQIALNGDPSVRVQTVIEGSPFSGIEIKNAKPMTVSFKSAFSEISKNDTDRLLLPIGKNISNKMITYPLNEMPHLLIAGTTGSGKSVLVHAIITTLIMRNYPNQLKLMLIDPKQVEFSKYEMEPHLFCPVISTPENAIVALERLINEMERRYTILSRNNCVKIAEYRRRRVGQEDTMEELPDIVCVIDEFADLMQTGGDAVSSYVQRLTAKARAAGIYLIIATQRPSKDAIPMIVKANIVCRIGLSCSTQVDSRVILDENGAETLVGKGDLLFKSPTSKSLIRCQSPYISDEDINRVLNYVKQSAGIPSYNADFLEFSPTDAFDLSEAEKSSEQIYQEIKEYVLETNTCTRESISSFWQLSQKQVNQFLSILEREGIIMRDIATGTYKVLRRF